MGAAKKFGKFAVGGALGTAVGAAVAMLWAPQSGTELQRSTRALIAETQVAGEQAQTETEAAMQQRFRNRVNDQSALRPEDQRES